MQGSPTKTGLYFGIKMSSYIYKKPYNPQPLATVEHTKTGVRIRLNMAATVKGKLEKIRFVAIDDDPEERTISIRRYSGPDSYTLSISASRNARVSSTIFQQFADNSIFPVEFIAGGVMFRY